MKPDSLGLSKYAGKLLAGWKKVLLWAVLGGVFGVIVGISTPRKYTSKAVLAPEITTRSTLGGISSLASLAGVNMNTMALTDAMHPDMYPAIIRSTNFCLELFELPVQVQTRDSVVHTDLYTYMVKYYKTPWWNYVLGFPVFAVHGIKSLFSSDKNEEMDSAGAQVDSMRLTRQQERVMRRLSKNIEATINKKTYLLNLRVTMQDPVIAAQLTNAIVEQLKVFVADYRTEKARENMEYFQVLCEQTKQDYLAAQRAYTYYVDTHQGLIGRSTQVHQQQLQNEAQLRFQMYSQTAQNLLNAEAKVQQDTPVLVVIQQGMAPHLGKPSRVRLLMLWTLIGAVLGAVYVCLKK